VLHPIHTQTNPQGENFDPNGFLKVNPRATVPVLVDDKGKYLSSADVVQQIIKLGPDSPKHDPKHDHELRKIIHAVHDEKHDPNTLLLLPVDDADLAEKLKGVPGGFIAGRQKALDR
jgi:hypothetical protein